MLCFERETERKDQNLNGVDLEMGGERKRRAPTPTNPQRGGSS